ncbi:hypothetical protein [Nonomuraea sp. NPDC050310]|uniref:hypothetical protein n=1 Tax=Nonomuraea sp. NPDC050310 TaxID=3154935 RepID=UPI0033C8F084
MARLTGVLALLSGMARLAGMALLTGVPRLARVLGRAPGGWLRAAHARRGTGGVGLRLGRVGLGGSAGRRREPTALGVVTAHLLFSASG